MRQGRRRSGDGIDKKGLAAHFFPDDQIGQGISADLVAGGEDPEGHPAARIGQMTRHYIAVAPVVARSADDKHPLALQLAEHGFGQRGDAAPGILHEQQRGQLQELLAISIEGGHLGGCDDYLHLYLRNNPESVSFLPERAGSRRGALIPWSAGSPPQRR